MYNDKKLSPSKIVKSQSHLQNGTKFAHTQAS